MYLPFYREEPVDFVLSPQVFFPPALGEPESPTKSMWVHVPGELVVHRSEVSMWAHVRRRARDVSLEVAEGGSEEVGVELKK